MEIRRDIHLKRLIASRHNRLIKIVTGIRRSGKSYLLRVLFKNYLIDNGIKEDHIIELDFENRRNKKYRDPDALLEYIDSRIVDEEMYYILLDEIQLVSEFEDVLNSYLSIKNADVYVTGSNSEVRRFILRHCRLLNLVRLILRWNHMKHFKSISLTVAFLMCAPNRTSRRKSVIFKDCLRRHT